MVKSSVLKKVVSAILVLSVVCAFSMVSCFAMDGPNKQGKLQEGTGYRTLIIPDEGAFGISSRDGGKNTGRKGAEHHDEWSSFLGDDGKTERIDLEQLDKYLEDDQY